MKDLKAVLSHQIFDYVKQASEKLGQETYVVGGFVRDIFLERPNKDIDFVTIGSGIDLAMASSDLMPQKPKVTVFKNFGTAQFVIDDLEIEFVGARKESYSPDSRKPTVENGSLSDDQLRRDFTINAMAISVNEAGFGTLVDPFNGIEDLHNKVLKTPLEPEKTFSDDPLRMMRAIRFATQLGFDIDPDTFEGIKSMANRISIISQERITDELNKIILSKVPSYGFKLLLQAGLLQIIFPEFVNLLGVETQDGKGHKDNFYHTLQVLDNVALKSDNLWLRWAAILHDIAKPATKRYSPKIGWSFHGHEELGSRWVKGIFARFRLPLDEKMRMVRNLVKLHLRPIALAKDGVTDSAMRRLLVDASEDLAFLMILCRADITSKDPNRVRRYLGNFDKVETLLFEVVERDKLRSFQPVFTGEHIMSMFSIGPSKEVGHLKSTLREAILDCKIENDFDASYDFVRIEAQKLNFTPVKTIESLKLHSVV
jgi:poly(A) polymerase